MAEWITNLGFVVGVVGLLLAVVGLFVGVKSWRRKKPTYFIHSNNIFSGLEHTIPDVEVKVAGYGSPVKALTVTKIAFWNAGTETIDGQDIVKANPISLRAKSGVVILSVSIIDRTSPFNKLECGLNSERTEATITFDYLDHRQGAVIQIFHSGVGNDDIQVEGTIKGARSIQRRSFPVPPKKQKRTSRWLAMTVVGVTWIFVVGLAYSFMIIDPRSKLLLQFRQNAGIDLLDGFVISALVFFGLVITVGVVRSVYITAVPKPLSKIWDP